jgi:hypothetical protein
MYGQINYFIINVRKKKKSEDIRFQINPQSGADRNDVKVDKVIVKNIYGYPEKNGLLPAIHNL